MNPPIISNFLPSFVQEPKEFKRQYLNVLQNQKYISKVQEATKHEILSDMEGRLEKIKHNAQMCKDKIAELEKDTSYQARQSRKTEEEILKNWQMKEKQQTDEIEGVDGNGGVKGTINQLQENQLDLDIFMRKAEEIK